MPIKIIRTFVEPVFQQLLRQPILGTTDISGGANVSGLTVIFTTPSVTVTFTGTNPLPPSTIVAQINAAAGANIAFLADFSADGSVDRTKTFLGLASATTSAIATSGSGTANPVLGLPAVAATAQDVTPANVIQCGKDIDNFFRAIVVTS